jgi:hypothetical protein
LLKICAVREIHVLTAAGSHILAGEEDESCGSPVLDKPFLKVYARVERASVVGGTESDGTGRCAGSVM